MTRKFFHGFGYALLGLMMAAGSVASAAAPSQQLIDAAASNDQFAFVMLYRSNDAATETMHQTLQSALAGRNDAVAVPVPISDPANQTLVQRFDASRLPLPAVVALAPNGAVCSVFPRRVSAQQITASFVTPGQAACLKALQDNQIVLLCVQPSAGAPIPAAVTAFQNNAMYRGRTTVVTTELNDPAEAEFHKQLRISGDRATTAVAFMAPPGAMLGVFDETVTFEQLAESIAAAGKCCDDENCKFNKAAAKSSGTRR